MTLAANLVPALTIAVIEEGFFRAFLLSGMADDFGTSTALIASSAVYAAAHLVRSPKRFEVTAYQPMVGMHNLAASLSHLGHPREAAPGLIGLFLLGLLLGVGFLQTRRVYFSIGLHASLVMGAKTFRKLAPGAQSAPGWLTGYGSPPLISGIAAWVITIVLLDGGPADVARESLEPGRSRPSGAPPGQGKEKVKGRKDPARARKRAVSRAGAESWPIPR